MAEYGATVAILGCGKLGISILQGLLLSFSSGPRVSQLHFRRIIATARTLAGAERIQSGIKDLTRTPDLPMIDVSTSERNIDAAKLADIIILGCKPNVLPEILTEDLVGTMEKSGQHKVLVSLAGGVRLDDIERLYESMHQSAAGYHTRLVRAISNLAASVQQSVTMCSSRTVGGLEQITHLFNLFGSTEWVAEEHMYTGSAIGASSLALYAAILKAVASSASEMPPEDALRLAALAMQGTATLALQGQAPEQIIEKVATPGGSTEAGLRVLEVQGVEPAVIEAIRETTQATRTMGNVTK